MKVNANDFIADTILCDKSTAVYNEIDNLMNVMTNQVLGAVPRFCRVNGHEQLSDKLENGELDLSKFVLALENIKTSKIDIIPHAKTDENFLKSTVFETMKYVILRNHWREASEDNRITLLLNEVCAKSDLNRLSRTVKDNSNLKKLNDKESLTNTVSVCKARELKDLTPFMSNDVIAEFFLNIKNVLPESYPKIKDLLCEEFLGLENLILKNNFDKKYTSTKAATEEVAVFGVWFKEVMANINNSSQIEKEIREKSFATIDSNLDWPGQQDVSEDSEPWKNALMSKNSREEFYKKNFVEGKPLVHPNYPDFYMVKNSKGEIVFKLTEEAKKNDLKEIIEYANSSNESIKKIAESSIKDLVVNLDQQIPMQDSESNYKLSKDKNGKYILEISDLELKKLKDLANQESSFPSMEAYNQEQLGREYKLQLNDPNYQSDKEELLGAAYKVIKTENGKYALDYGVEIPAKLDQQEVYNQEILKLMSEESHKEVLPGPILGTLLVKNNKGEFKSVNANDLFPKSFEGEEKFQGYILGSLSNPDKFISKTEQLRAGVSMKYQETAMLNKKLDTLETEEFRELKSYTGTSFQELNTCLRETNCSNSQNERINKVISGLNKIKEENAEYRYVYRGFSKIPDFIKDKLDKNEKGLILDKGFMSTTGDLEVAQSFSHGMTGEKGYVVMIKAKSCVGISAISNFEQEDEFLCPPGMKFNVKKVEGSEKTYYLEEVK